MKKYNIKMLSPIVSVVGHVDVGKTSFLDYYSKNKTKEINGITQDIRVLEYTSEEIKNVISNDNFNKNFELDKIIFIDTPGHSYFSSQRELTTKLSHISILIIDIIHGLNETHLELLKYFKKNNIEFIILLNKIDTIYNWKSSSNSSLKNSFAKQTKDNIKSLNDYMNNVIWKLAEYEINAAPYYSNSDYKTYVSIVPISAKTGEGMMDISQLLSKLLSKKMSKLNLNESYNNINGYIIDTVNGVYGKGFKYIHQKSSINITMNDSLLFLNKSSYEIKHILKKNIKIDKIDEPGVYTIIFEKNKDSLDCGDISIIDINIPINFESISSCNLINLDLSIDPNEQKDSDEFNKLTEETINLDKFGIGIIINTKSMEKPIYNMFRQLNIPVSLSSFEKISKNHIIKVANNNKTKDKLLNIKYDKFRVIVCLDPTFSTDLNKSISSELLEFAESSSIKIIYEKTIYKLKEKYERYLKDVSERIKNKYNHLSKIELEILPQFIFTKTSPLVMGVKIKKGLLNPGVILEAFKDNKKVVLGTVKSIQHEKNNVIQGKTLQEVCIKIEHIDKKIIYKTDFDETYILRTYFSEEDQKIYELFKEDIEKIDC
jgi:translation initiation factor 5B